MVIMKSSAPLPGGRRIGPRVGACSALWPRTQGRCHQLTAVSTLGAMTDARPVLRSRAWPVALGVAALVLAGLASTGIDGPGAVVPVLVGAALAIAAVIAWAAWRSTSQRREYEGHLTAWAAERAVNEERLRIARDLHDLASHGLGLISVRAAAARAYRGQGAEDERAAALADIESAARGATVELRRLLRVLRREGEPAPRRPALSFRDLPEVLQSATDVGVTATLTVDPSLAAAQVPAAVQLTSVEVVREGLANVARHAGPTAARVGVHLDAATLTVTVEDDGPAAGWVDHPGGGVGLTGLAERVGLHGGAIDLADTGTGKRLSARIPLASS